MRTHNGLRSAEFKTLGDIRDQVTNISDLLKLRNFGRKSLQEVIEVMDRIETAPTDETDALSADNRTDLPVRESLIPYLERLYRDWVEKKLDVRTRNFIGKNLEDFNKVLKYLWSPMEGYRYIAPRQGMKKTLLKLYDFHQLFIKEAERLNNLDDKEIHKEKLMADYPFLTPDELGFVLQFEEAVGRLPLLFILWRSLMTSETSFDQIYRMIHGFNDGKPVLRNDVAKQVSLTPERVRQLLVVADGSRQEWSRDQKAEELYPDLWETAVTDENSRTYVRYNGVENLNLPFRQFAPLVALMGGFTVKMVGGHFFLIKTSVLKKIDFKEMLLTVESRIAMKRLADETVDLAELTLRFPVDLRKTAGKLMKSVAVTAYGVEIAANGKLILPKNSTDFSEEFYSILDDNGAPMHIDEVFKEFKRRFPGHKYVESIQIKPYLFRHPHIRSIGKTSLYALDKWENVYFGTIRNLLQEILAASESPLRMDEIFEKVKPVFPNTTRSSLISTMIDSDFKRFVLFEGGYYGLSAKIYPASYRAVEDGHHSPYSFEEREKNLYDFIERNGHFPVYSGEAEEASLARWLSNIGRGKIEATEEQKRRLDERLGEYAAKGLPKTATEVDFFFKCKELREHIKTHKFLPTRRSNPILCSWLRSAGRNVHKYDDRRSQYWKELSEFALSHGFLL